jgi:hypothetical protein
MDARAVKSLVCPQCCVQVGYFFLEESVRSGYEPPVGLRAFLDAGPPPVYLGFGSMVIDNPQSLTRKVAGRR